MNVVLKCRAEYLDYSLRIFFKIEGSTIKY